MNLQPKKGFQGNINLPDQDLIIFFGQNNCGKSSILYSINSTYGKSSDYISPRRFDLSNEVVVTRQFQNEMSQQQDQRKHYDENSCELSAPDPIRELFSLSDTQRDIVLKWHNKYFGEIIIEKLNPENEFSPPKITIDGKLPSQQGTGSRAIMPILIKLMDPTIKILCIDEPELGIEPNTQKKLFDLIRKVSIGDDGLPKKRIIIATHSNLFIDKFNFSNNFQVVKENNIVNFFQISDEISLQKTVFSLLGNDPSDLFFPANILLVEGKSDEIYFRRIYQLMVEFKLLDQKNIAFHFCGGFDKVGYAVEAVVQMLKTQAYMPIYKEKICGIFDKPTQNKKLVENVRLFVNDSFSERFVLLEKDAIEYYYPLDSVKKIIGNSTITNDEFQNEIAKYLQEVKSKGFGNFFTLINLSKVKFAQMISEEINDLNGIDSKIINAITKCVKFSY